MKRHYNVLREFLNHSIGEPFTIRDAKIDVGVLRVTVFKTLPANLDSIPITVRVAEPAK